jgi:hypothetical protein
MFPLEDFMETLAGKPRKNSRKKLAENLSKMFDDNY